MNTYLLWNTFTEYVSHLTYYTEIMFTNYKMLINYNIDFYN